jgi:hypothetical protein
MEVGWGKDAVAWEDADSEQVVGTEDCMELHMMQRAWEEGLVEDGLGVAEFVLGGLQ